MSGLESILFTSPSLPPSLRPSLHPSLLPSLQNIPDQEPLELTPSLFLKVSPENYMFTSGCNDSTRWTYTPDFPLPSSFLNSTNFSSAIDPNILFLPPFLNSTLSNVTDALGDFELTAPSPLEYLASLFRPCGIGASELDPDLCGAGLGAEFGGEGCQGEPGLRCSSVCGECDENSTDYLSAEPPTCFAGSLSS